MRPPRFPRRGRLAAHALLYALILLNLACGEDAEQTPSDVDAGLPEQLKIAVLMPQPPGFEGLRELEFAAAQVNEAGGS